MAIQNVPLVPRTRVRGGGDASMWPRLISRGKRAVAFAFASCAVPRFRNGALVATVA
jgi:hypothetical protein